MKKIYVLLFCILFYYSGFGQRFSPPTPGKSIVCIACVDDGTSGELYHNDKYIGQIISYRYTMYEFDPGDHLFWTEVARKAAAGYFLEAKLEKDKIYVLVPSSKKSWAANYLDYKLTITPLDISDTVRYKRIKRLFKYVEPVATSQKEIDKKNKKNDAFIDNKLNQYHKWKEEGKLKKIGTLSPDQFIPIEILNN